MAATPDLLIDSISAPLTVEKNAKLNFSYVVKNAGTAAISSFGSIATAEIDDETPAYPDGASANTGAMAAGATKTISASLNTTGLGLGEHTLWIAADSFNDIAESNETNNLTSVTFTIVDTKPDLTVTTLFTEELSVVEGDDLDFSYLVENLGGSASSAGSIFYNFDQQPSLSHRTGPIGGAFVEAGGAVPVSETISTAGLTVGQHTLWVSVDATNARSESDETNNLASVTFTVTAKPRPDQIIESITGPNTVMQGADLDFSYVLKDANSANTTDSSSVILFAIDRQPTSSSYDYIVGAGALPAGGSLTLDEVLHANLSVGEHTLWIKADGLNDVAEENESNNLQSFTFTVTEPPRADLSVIDAYPASGLVVERGTDLNAEYLIKNLGTAASPASTVGFMFDQQADAAHYVVASTISGLAVGETQTYHTLVDTTSLSVGQHTLWVVADVFGAITESSEANNAKAVTFTVSEATRPDLVISSIVLPPSIAWTDEIEISFVVKNTGLVAAGASTLNYQFRSTFDPNLGSSVEIGPLAPGESQTVSVVVDTTGGLPGESTLWVMADARSLVNETREANNLSSVTFTVGPATAKPDLFVPAWEIHADASAPQDSFFSFSYKIANIGTGAAGNTVTIFGIDEKPAYGSFTPTQAAGPLAGGASATYNGVISTSELSLGVHKLWIGVDAANSQAEKSEVNNWTSITFEVTRDKPDLAIASLVAQGLLVAQGNNLDFSYVVRNLIGGITAAPSTVLYGIDQQPTAGNSAGSALPGSLPSGSSAAMTGSLSTAGLSVGQHTLWVAADGTNGQTESDETNNVQSIIFTVTAPVPPDLVVDGITAPVSVVKGANLDVSYVIKNIGEGAALSATKAVYSIDVDPNVGGAPVANSTNPLVSGASQTLSQSIDTSRLSVGQHTLWIKADGLGQIAETNESNNWTSVTFTVTPPPGADLEVASIAAATSVVQGAKLDFSFMVKNTGAAGAGSNWAGFRIDSQPDSTHADGYIAVGSLAADGTQTLNSSINTSTLSVGTHTLYVMADYWNNQVTEGDETNNLTSFTFTVTAPPRPDLVVDSITAASTVVQGNLLDLSYVIKNAGAAGAGSSWAGFRIDSQPDSTHADGYGAIGPLAAAGAQTLGGRIDTSTLSVGTHTLYVMADYWNNQVAEGDEGNNVRSVTFTVTAPVLPDLVVSAISGMTTSVVQGTKLAFSFLVENTADSRPTAGNWAGFRIDSQPDSTHADGYIAVGSLAADGTQTLSSSIDTSKLSVGTHTLYVMADYWNNQVAEGDETNNVASFTFTVTAPPRPDLVVSSITPAATSVMQGANLNFSYLIENLGDASSSANWAGIWIDQQPGSANTAGFNQTAALATGGGQTLSNSISTANLSVGEHTLYVAADYWGNQVGESNEGNNWQSVTFEVTAPPRPDLIVSRITTSGLAGFDSHWADDGAVMAGVQLAIATLGAGPTSVVQGQKLEFAYFVANTAADIGAAGSWAGFRIDGQPDDTHYDGFNFTEPLAGGGTQMLSNSIDTSTLSVGTHTLWVKADYWGNAVAESDETNNLTSFTFEVTAADLEVSSITPAATSVMQGAAFTFSYVVENGGTAASGASWAGFMVDHAVDLAHYIGFGQTNALAVDGTQTLTGTINTAGLGVGTHTLYVAADYWNNMVGEGNEANNVRSVTFEVTAPVPADLAVDSITPAATSVVRGQSLDFSYVIKNAAAGLPAGASWAGIMIDQAADQAHYVAFNQTGALAAGASQTLSNSIDTSGLAAGTHTLHVAADYWGNMVAEGNEANNALSITFTVIDPFA